MRASSIVASYFNCFALLKTYRHLGIGMVRCDDAEKLLGLFYAVRYLCKERSVMLIRTPGVRVTSDVARSTATTFGVGPPRQMEDDLRLAESVLLRPRPRKEGGCAPGATSRVPVRVPSLTGLWGGQES